jgi:hypothetical protein
MIRFPVLILAGLLSMPLMEVFSMLWFRVAPANLDLTANYFLMVVLPAALVLHFLMALLLWKAFEPSPKTGGAVYLGTHITAQVIELSYLGNPLADVVSYGLVLLLSGSLILFVFNRYFWCPQCAGPI